MKPIENLDSYIAQARGALAAEPRDTKRLGDAMIEVILQACLALRYVRQVAPHTMPESERREFAAKNVRGV